MTAGLFEDDDWGRVVVNNGEYARVDALAGHLIIVCPIGYVEHSPTRFSQAGKPSDAVALDVIDLDDVDEFGQPGKVYRNSWWRGAQLILALRPRIGGKVLGVIGKGVAKNGMNAPWVIEDMSQNPELVERARQWGRAHADFVVSPFQPQASPPPAPQNNPYQQGYDPFPQGAVPAPPRFPVQQQGGYGPPQGYQAPPQQGGYSNGANGPGYGQQPQGYGQSNTGYTPPQQQAPQGGYSAAPQGYSSQQGGPVVPPTQQVSADDMAMLARMRERRQQESTYPQQGYSENPPF